MTVFGTNGSILSQNFMDFLVCLRQFVLAKFDQFLCAFQLFRHLVDVEFIVLHLAHDGTMVCSSAKAASYFVSLDIII